MRSNSLRRFWAVSLAGVALAFLGVGEALAQAEPLCPRVYAIPRNATAVVDPNPTIRIVVNSISAKTTASELQDIYSSCQRELSPKKNQISVPALLCMARAQTKMAQFAESERNSGEADCALNAASTLLSRRSDAKALVAEAGQARGDLLMGWRQRGAATRPAGQLLADAISAYSAAVAAEPTYDRYFALGQAQLEAGRSADAVAAFKAAYNQDRTKAPEFAKSVLAVAEQKLSALPTTPAERGEALKQVLTVLGEAQSALPKSISINSALGATYFHQGAFDLSRDAVGRILSPSSATAASDAVNDVQPNGKNYLAQALYYRSVINARTSPRAFGVLGDAQAAAAGSSEYPYRRQACLAFVATGGDAMKADQITQCEIDSTPEGELLRGMLLLRRAQYLNPGTITPGPKRTKYETVIGDASKAFARGLNALRDAPETPITWPDFTATASLRDALQYGRSIAWQCQSPVGTRDPYDLDEGLRARARAFFSRYNALNCSAT